jgi:hypothetical protein
MASDVMERLIGPARFAVLETLLEASGAELGLGELVRRCGRPKSTVRGAVDALAAAGIVTRRRWDGQVAIGLRPDLIPLLDDALHAGGARGDRAQSSHTGDAPAGSWSHVVARRLVEASLRVPAARELALHDVDGQTVARFMLPADGGRRRELGTARGQFEVPADFDEPLGDEVLAEFEA